MHEKEKQTTTLATAGRSCRRGRVCGCWYVQTIRAYQNEPTFCFNPALSRSDSTSTTTAEQSGDHDEQLLLAAKAGAARELYEETGMDMLRQLHRLQPAQVFRDKNGGDALKKSGLPNLYKSRLFFFLPVTDDDFPKGHGVTPMGPVGTHLTLKLSVEHSGFIFQPEPADAAEMLQHHSGGKCSEALLMAQNKDGETTTLSTQSLLSGSKITPSSEQETSMDERSAPPIDLTPPPKRDEGCCCFGR